MNELRARTDDLTELLEQQTATSEVLRSSASSKFELAAHPAERVDTAARLCRADAAVIFRLSCSWSYRFAAGYSLEPAPKIEAAYADFSGDRNGRRPSRAEPASGREARMPWPIRMYVKKEDAEIGRSAR